jgi:hypothetical protein
MPGRVKAVVLLSFLVLVSANVAADCSQWTATTSSPFRTTAYDLSVDGNFLWVATGYGVQLLEEGRIVDSIGLPGTTRVVKASGNGYAYAGSGSSVYVLRRNGRSITTLTSIALANNINDLEIVSSSLVAAINGGIVHFDLLNPAAPARTNVVLQTSTPFVTSLATAKNKLYAADGDATVEVFSMAIPLLPQHIGTLTSIPRASSVHATADDEVYISDRFGQGTDVYDGTTFRGRVMVVSTSFAASIGEVHFVAGPDRTLRAVDFSNVARPVELYATQLSTTDGNVNVINAMALVGKTLYVAAGDIGLVTLDTTTIASPYPLVSYTTIGATTGVRIATDKAWVSTIGGGITQFRIDPAAIALVEERGWFAGAGSVVRDYRDNGLLTTSGTKATVWALVTAVPVQATNVTFDAPIENAVMSSSHLVALLSNGNVWAAVNGQTTPAQVALPPMTFLARAGSALAFAEVRDTDEKTVIHYYPTGDLATTPQRFTLDGAAVGSVALDATRAAVFTFEGVTIIDLANGNVRRVPNSSLVIPRQMAFSGDDLLVMDSRRLLVYDNAQTLVRDHELPAEARAFDTTSTVATIATAAGTTAIRYMAELPQVATSFSNRFYRQFAAAAGRAYLFDHERIDVISTVMPQKPQYVTTIEAPGLIDLAANDAGLFTLSGNGTVTAYSRAGMQYAQASISEGFASQPIAIHTAGNAVWVSLGVGCNVQTCNDWKTLVLDPGTLAVTTTLPGSVTDVDVSGTRAYALSAFPDQIRVLNIADPLHPAPLVTAVGKPLAASIQFAAGKVYVLAGKVYGYTEATLTQVEERLTGSVSAAPQRLRIDGTCAVISRDANPPVLYDLPSWTTSARQFTLPSPLRSFVLEPSLLLILTDHSLEIAHPAPTGTPPRRRSAR